VGVGGCGCRGQDQVGSGQASEFPGARDVVVVEMGLEHPPDRHSLLAFEPVEEAVDVALGVDDDGLVGVSEQVGGVSQAGSADGFDLHVYLLKKRGRGDQAPGEVGDPSEPGLCQHLGGPFAAGTGSAHDQHRGVLVEGVDLEWEGAQADALGAGEDPLSPLPGLAHIHHHAAIVFDPAVPLSGRYLFDTGHLISPQVCRVIVRTNTSMHERKKGRAHVIGAGFSTRRPLCRANTARTPSGSPCSHTTTSTSPCSSGTRSQSNSRSPSGTSVVRPR
jgi:hypothetical protein